MNKDQTSAKSVDNILLDKIKLALIRLRAVPSRVPLCNSAWTTMSSPLNLDEEVRLYTTNAEREKYSLLATLFGIVVSLDYLERAYVRDSVTAAE